MLLPDCPLPIIMIQQHLCQRGTKQNAQALSMVKQYNLAHLICLGKYIEQCTIQMAHLCVRPPPSSGALALALDLDQQSRSGSLATMDEVLSRIRSTMACLVTSRPTAVNLADSEQKINAQAAALAAEPAQSPAGLVESVIRYCEALYDEDIASNRALGSFGAEVNAAGWWGIKMCKGFEVPVHTRPLSCEF